MSNKAVDYVGDYTFGLEIPEDSQGDQRIPQGNGYGGFKVADAGGLTLAGRTADGLSFSVGSFAGPAGQIVVFVPFSPSQGSLLGCPVITAGSVNNGLAGSLSWSKGKAPAVSKDYAYRAGFPALDLQVAGGKYSSPGIGGVLMDLPNVDGNARLNFAEGGLLAGQAPTVVFSIRNLKPSLAVQTVTLPDAGGTLNPARVSFAILASPPGQFNGSLTIPHSLPALVRKVSYQGTVVRLGSSYQAVGFFLMPQLPQPGQTLTTSPVLSGQVVLEATGP